MPKSTLLKEVISFSGVVLGKIKIWKLFFKIKVLGWECSSAIESLLSMYKTLGSISSIRKKNKFQDYKNKRNYETKENIPSQGLMKCSEDPG